MERGADYPRARRGWRTRENILAPEGPSGKEGTLGEEAVFEEQTAKGFPKSKKDGRPGVKKLESRARKFTTNCMWIFRSETSPRHRQKKTLTADETSQVTDRWHRKGGWPTAHCSAARRVLGDNGAMPSKARVKVLLPPSSASS